MKNEPLSKYSTINSKILDTSKMRNVIEDELRMDYDNMSNKTDQDDSTQKTNSSRFDIPAFKPVSNLLVNYKHKQDDVQHIYENQPIAVLNPNLSADKISLSNRQPSFITTESNSSNNNTYNIEKNKEIRDSLKEKLKELRTRDSDNNTSLSSNQMPSEFTDTYLQNDKAPAYKLPSTKLNIPYYNPNIEPPKQDDMFSQPVKFNSKAIQNSSIVAALLRNRLENQNIDQQSNSNNSELSAESRKKIDDVKAKLEALSKKYAAETVSVPPKFNINTEENNLASNSIVDKLSYGGLGKFD
jgi:hypothetical protein